MDDETGVSRRSFNLGLLVALTAACNPARKSMAETKIQYKTLTPLEAKEFAGLWDVYAARFLDPSGRIIDTGNKRISHSEGQGYGSLFAFYADDRGAFESIANWTEKTLGRQDIALHSWKYDPAASVPVSDHNNASDGDILIAWALADAGVRWGVKAWADRSAAIRSAIRSHLIVPRYGYHLLLPALEGFVEPGKITVNPSYFIWPAFDVFAEHDGKGVWAPLATDAARIVSGARFGINQLPTDWLDVTGPGDLAPAQGRDPRFGYDAIRVPLHALGANRAQLVAPIAAYWRGLRNQQQPIPAWTDVITGEVAPYPMSEGGEAVVDRLIGGNAPTDLSSDYFAASLQMLSKLLR